VVAASQLLPGHGLVQRPTWPAQCGRIGRPSALLEAFGAASRSRSIERFFRWHDEIGRIFSAAAGKLPAAIEEQLKWDYLGADFAGSIVSELADRYGASSAVARQGDLLLDSYRDFTSWLHSDPVAGAPSDFSPISIAGSAIGTQVLTGAAGALA
jgi:hypothetical protein